MRENNRYNMNKAMIMMMRTEGTCKCTCCDKDLTMSNSHMHHRASDTKLFNVSSHYDRVDTTLLIAEANKCDALCDTCHNLLHTVKGTSVTEADTLAFYDEYKVGMHKDMSIIEYWTMLNN